MLFKGCAESCVIGISYGESYRAYRQIRGGEQLCGNAHSFLDKRLMHSDPRAFFEHSVEIIGVIAKLCGDAGIVDVLVVVLLDVEHGFLNQGRQF